MPRSCLGVCLSAGAVSSFEGSFEGSLESPHAGGESRMSEGKPESAPGRSARSGSVAAVGRPRVSGKFLFVGDEKLYVRGVTYGAFRPNAAGNEYHDLDVIERDFAQMAANGVNAVRIPHTAPPRSLLDAAQRHGLRVMVGLSAEQYVGYLIDRRGAPDLERMVR